jgi:hypothetical protein
MNHLFFLWSAVRSACEALNISSDRQDQRAVEAYLSQSQSVSELEYRERQWLRSH